MAVPITWHRAAILTKKTDHEGQLQEVVELHTSVRWVAEQPTLLSDETDAGQLIQKLLGEASEQVKLPHTNFSGNQLKDAHICGW